MSATLVESTVEIRSGDGFQVADVNFPKRIVTVVAMPYERPADVAYGQRMVTEVVSRGAFNGIEKRAGKIKANRDHTWDKTVGKPSPCTRPGTRGWSPRSGSSEPTSARRR